MNPPGKKAKKIVTNGDPNPAWCIQAGEDFNQMFFQQDQKMKPRGVCLKYHINKECVKGCPKGRSHHKLVDYQKKALTEFVNKCSKNEKWGIGQGRARCLPGSVSLTPATRHWKKSPSPASKIKKNSKTAPLPALPKTFTILPPPPPLKPVKKPDSWKDAGVDEVLGKEITANESVTYYSATASTCSYHTLDKQTHLIQTKCTKTVNEGKYF